MSASVIKTNEFSITNMNKLIEAISKGQAKTARDIGKAILCAVYLSIVQKDAGGANALLKCLRKSTKLTAIIDTLEAFGNLGYKDSDKTFGHFEVTGRVWPQGEDLAKLRLQCMEWESYRVAKPVESLDVAEKLEALISSVAKAQKGKREVLHAELIADVSRILGAYHMKVAAE